MVASLAMDWRETAVCITTEDLGVFFQEDPSEAKLTCFRCPARLACLDEACRIQAHEDLYGVWGGLTQKERETLVLRRHLADGQIEVIYEELTEA